MRPAPPNDIGYALRQALRQIRPLAFFNLRARSKVEVRNARVDLSVCQ